MLEVFDHLNECLFPYMRTSLWNYLIFRSITDDLKLNLILEESGCMRRVG
jgi:hypothetical protein